MILDIIGLILVIIFFVRGYMKGIIVAAFSFLAIILGIILSLRLSEKLSSFLFDKQIITSAWVQPASYLIIFIGIILLVRLLAKAVETMFEAVMLGWVNKLTGGLLYAFLIAMIWSSLIWVGTKLQLIAPQTITNSVTYPFFYKLAPWIVHHIGAIIPTAKNLFQDLETYFRNINDHVGSH